MLPVLLAVVLVLCFLNWKAWSNMWKDKDAAKENQWRIPERELLCDALFGWPCGLMAMYMSRHKVRKPEFLILYYCCCCFGVVIYIIIGYLLLVFHGVV